MGWSRLHQQDKCCDVGLRSAPNKSPAIAAQCTAVTVAADLHLTHRGVTWGRRAARSVKAAAVFRAKRGSAPHRGTRPDGCWVLLGPSAQGVCEEISTLAACDVHRYFVKCNSRKRVNGIYFFFFLKTFLSQDIFTNTPAPTVWTQCSIVMRECTRRLKGLPVQFGNKRKCVCAHVWEHKKPAVDRLSIEPMVKVNKPLKRLYRHQDTNCYKKKRNPPSYSVQLTPQIGTEVNK